MSRIGKSTETEVDQWLVGAGEEGRGNGKWLLMGMGFLLGAMKMF